MTNTNVRIDAQREDTVLSALRRYASSEPISVAEVLHGIKAVQKAGTVDDMRKYDENTVRATLRHLVTKGRIYSRTESLSERAVRSNGPARGYEASLFSVLHPVPQRVTKSLVQGIVLGDGSTVYESARKASRKYYKKNKTKINAKNYARNKADIIRKRGGDAYTPSGRPRRLNSDQLILDLSALIENHVQLRNDELNRRVAELEMRLATIAKHLTAK